jgi:hypothetical protein
MRIDETTNVYFNDKQTAHPNKPSIAGSLSLFISAIKKIIPHFRLSSVE